MKVKDRNLFELHKKKTLFTVVLIIFILLFMTCEFLLQKFMGLGNPVIYDSSPIYGFRPLPDRVYSRFRGTTVKFNNLGLRSDSNWDANRDNKVLFLGDSVTYGGSYIGNNELFSSLTVEILNKKNKLNYISGNAGVNGWGIENIYGLIVEKKFIPAASYITTLPEGDFYRGLSRMQGTPFFNRKPGLALLELWYFFCYRQNNKRYLEWQEFSDMQDKEYVVEKAVKKLKKLNTFLEEKGYKHLIFISPSKSQVMEGNSKDELIHRLLLKYHLQPHYIIDEIPRYEMTINEKQGIFHDSIHLEKKGHALWAKIIAKELEIQFLR